MPSTPPPARAATVAPFARAMHLLMAFTPYQRWLDLPELQARAALPRATAMRIVQSLVALGYLQRSDCGRRYGLAPAVLALGCGAGAGTEVDAQAEARLRAFAVQHRLQLAVAARDRLDMEVRAAWCGPGACTAVRLHTGLRVALGRSPLGWALIGGLPAAERDYLLDQVDRRAPARSGGQRRSLHQALVQLERDGFCSGLAEDDGQTVVLAAPLPAGGGALQVLACAAPAARGTRSGIERALGPGLRALAASIGSAGRPPAAHA